jgi:hypothetical protein
VDQSEKKDVWKKIKKGEIHTRGKKDNNVLRKIRNTKKYIVVN